MADGEGHMIGNVVSRPISLVENGLGPLFAAAEAYRQRGIIGTQLPSDLRFRPAFSAAIKKKAPVEFRSQ